MSHKFFHTFSTHLTGPSLVQDEASVVITGKIQTSKMFRVIGHNEITVLLVIQEGITDETWMDNSFKLSYKAYGMCTYFNKLSLSTFSYEVTSAIPTDKAMFTQLLEGIPGAVFSC